MSSDMVERFKVAAYRATFALLATGACWVATAMANQPFSFGGMAPVFLFWWMFDAPPHRSDLPRWGWGDE